MLDPGVISPDFLDNSVSCFSGSVRQVAHICSAVSCGWP